MTRNPKQVKLFQSSTSLDDLNTQVNTFTTSGNVEPVDGQLYVIYISLSQGSIYYYNLIYIDDSFDTILG